MVKTCLVTGGLGYIGSHICVELLNSDYDLIIIDNLSNSKIEKLNNIKKFNKFNNHIFFYSNVNLIKKELEWSAKYSISDSVKL